jgi:hypothetical protein
MKKMTLILTVAAFAGLSGGLNADSSNYQAGKMMATGVAGMFLNPLLDQASHAMVNTIGKAVGLNDATANQLGNMVAGLSQQGSQALMSKGIDYGSAQASKGASYASGKFGSFFGR